ncbi:MAG: hypothetical protein F6K45_21360 [Kamptonema sp. SIO1D9]|nr:hypothetical protein [Kamptonema sp. SIO1D9]
MSLFIELKRKVIDNSCVYKDSINKNFDRMISDWNQMLECCGLPCYRYLPKELSKDTLLPSVQYSSDDLDYLKFIAALLSIDPSWTPDRDFINKQIPFNLKKEIIAENKSHLICHHNCFGQYFPISFQDVDLPNDFLSTMGSSINLRDELVEIAEKLDLSLGEYTPDLDLLYEQRLPELQEDILGFEKMLLLDLYNISLGSIKHNLIINFSG